MKARFTLKRLPRLLSKRYKPFGSGDVLGQLFTDDDYPLTGAARLGGLPGLYDFLYREIPRFRLKNGRTNSNDPLSFEGIVDRTEGLSGDALLEQKDRDAYRTKQFTDILKGSRDFSPLFSYIVPYYNAKYPNSPSDVLVPERFNVNGVREIEREWNPTKHRMEVSQWHPKRLVAPSPLFNFNSPYWWKLRENLSNEEERRKFAEAFEKDISDFNAAALESKFGDRSVLMPSPEMLEKWGIVNKWGDDEGELHVEPMNFYNNALDMISRSSDYYPGFLDKMDEGRREAARTYLNTKFKNDQVKAYTGDLTPAERERLRERNDAIIIRNVREANPYNRQKDEKQLGQKWKDIRKDIIRDREFKGRNNFEEYMQKYGDVFGARGPQGEGEVNPIFRNQLANMKDRYVELSEKGVSGKKLLDTLVEEAINAVNSADTQKNILDGLGQ